MSTLGSFIWSIADQLRGPYRPNQYGNVILPLTILRRLDCILEPDRETVRELAAKYDNPNRLKIEVKKATGRPFYNTSNYSFANLLADADGLADNLADYIDRFSPDVDVFEYFDFKKEILALEKAELLREVVTSFKAVDLHPDVVSNADMGDAFEYIIRKFNEAANETSGDHYTPRDAIRLLVDLLFAEKDADLTEAGIVRTLYDPTAGTGGMLSLAEEHLLAQNPDAKLSLYGQEYNPQSYAICKSDLLAKGHDATNIAFGNTLTDDAFKGRQFDFCMSNPPYGVDWKQYAKAVTKERDEAGPYGRFAPGLPSTSDGQMLFLLHLAHKMRAPEDGGGRAGIVMNGSPLFNGAAESGPSNIRKWLLENDLVDAIVALPTNMFFNTGIATYIWILDNTKHPDRKGLVQLIDGTSFWTKMRKNLGSKGREISDADRAKVVKLVRRLHRRRPGLLQGAAQRRVRLLDHHRRTPPPRRVRQAGRRPQGQAQAGPEEARHRERPVHLRRLDRRRGRQGRGHPGVLRRRGEAARPRRLDRLGQGQDRLRDPLHPPLLQVRPTPPPRRDRRRPGEAGRQDPRPAS